MCWFCYLRRPRVVCSRAARGRPGGEVRDPTDPAHHHHPPQTRLHQGGRSHSVPLLEEEARAARAVTARRRELPQQAAGGALPQGQDAGHLRQRGRAGLQGEKTHAETSRRGCCPVAGVQANGRDAEFLKQTRELIGAAQWAHEHMKDPSRLR